MIDKDKNYSEVNDLIDNMEADGSYSDLTQPQHQVREKIHVQKLITLIKHCTDRDTLKMIDTNHNHRTNQVLLTTCPT